MNMKTKGLQIGGRYSTNIDRKAAVKRMAAVSFAVRTLLNVRAHEQN